MQAETICSGDLQIGKVANDTAVVLVLHRLQRVNLGFTHQKRDVILHALNGRELASSSSHEQGSPPWLVVIHYT